MKKIALSLAILGAMLAVIHPESASAQGTSAVTFVSGSGSDGNPQCNAVGPCATLAVALAKTRAGGEVVCAGSGYNGVNTTNITFAVTISCEGVDFVENTITVNAGANDIVVLRGLDIQFFPGFPSGIQFNSGAALRIENCNISGFTEPPDGWGIQFAPTGASELYVSNTTIINNGNSSTGGGILVKAAAGAVTKAVLDHVTAERNFRGIKVDGTGAAGGVVQATVRDSVSSGNLSNGIVATGDASGATLIMLVEHSVASQNATAGFGVIADGPKTTIRLGNSVVAGNINGIGASNGGILVSYGNNDIDGNSNNGSPTAMISTK